MPAAYQKVDDTTIQVTASTTVETVHTYTHDYLVKQRQAILEQQQRDNDQRNREIAEIDEILTQGSKLGVGVAVLPLDIL